MARKVAATPVLKGEDAKRFIKRLDEPATPEEIEHFKKARKIFKEIEFIK